MPYVVVTIEIDPRELVDLSLPLDVPSKSVATAVIQGLGKSLDVNGQYVFFVKTDQGTTRISSNATLGDAGVLDGYYLLLKHEAGKAQSDEVRNGVYLRTESGQLISLEGATMIVGRRDVKRGVLVEIDLSPFDSGKVVSRRHASIEAQGGKYYLTDLRSTNGTKLNGKHVNPEQRQVLVDGDSIEFGRNGVRVTFLSK